MRLTSFTDYGLRALMRLASDPGRSFSTADLAAEFSLSRHHLAKIIAVLVEAGILATQAEHCPQGVEETPVSQLSDLAKMRAIVVLPTPRRCR